MKKCFKKMFATALVTVLAAASAVPAMAAEGARASDGVYEAYADFLTMYKMAQDNHFYAYDLSNPALQNINQRLPLSPDLQLSYTLVDLANDGTPELFIADQSDLYESGYNIRDSYGYNNGMSGRIFDDMMMGERTSYAIMNGGVIRCWVLGSAKSYGYYFYQVGQDSRTPNLVRYLEYDGWYGDQFIAGYNSNVTQTRVTEAQFQSILNSYTFKTDLTWYPIGDLSGLRAALQEEAIPVILNGVELDCDQPPVIVDGRTLVPLRTIFEGLGASVDWDGATRTVTSTLDGTTVVMTVDSVVMVKNGEAVTLDVPAKIVNGRTMVPVRAVGEAFGADVRWDGATRTVYVTQ